MAKLIFVNLPVSDLDRATAFYQAVGAEKNEQFCDGTASCMVFSETIHAMLLTHDKFRQFTPKKIADAKTSTEVLICLSADSRAAVDDMVGKAQAAGADLDLRVARRQGGDVHQPFRTQYAELHQVDQRRAAGQELHGRPAVARAGPLARAGGLGDVCRALVSEGAHQPRPILARASCTAATIFG